MQDQVFNLIIEQNRQTHELLAEFRKDVSEIRKDFHEHIAEDAKVGQRIGRIETTLSNIAWTFGSAVGVVGVVVAIVQIFK